MKVFLSNFLSFTKSQRTQDKVKEGKKKTEKRDIFHGICLLSFLRPISCDVAVQTCNIRNSKEIPKHWNAEEIKGGRM